MDPAFDQTGSSTRVINSEWERHLSATAGVPPARRLLTGAAIALIFFAGIAPTLWWLEFSNGIENLNVETALEMRRGGPWIIPTLMGEPRVRKPPLCAWITALAIDPKTVNDMSSPNTATREAAWKALAWQVRWPTLLAACLTLGLTYELGYTLIGHSAGIISAIVAGSTMLFLRYSRWAATDVHLALWVTAANVCLAKLIFERKIWLGLVGTGIPLGFGIMSKGPVALVMSIAPAAVFVLWREVVSRHAGAERSAAPDGSAAERGSGYRCASKKMIRGGAALCPGMIVPLVLGLTLMLLVGLSWFLYVMRTDPGQRSVWWMEVFRSDPAEASTSHWYNYIALLPNLLPWVPFVLAGFCFAAAAAWKATMGQLDHDDRQRALRIIYVGMLVVVPIFIMSCFRDRKPRYLYPFAVPCGVLTAVALTKLTWDHSIVRWLGRVQRMILAGMVIGLPLVGMLGMFNQVRVDGSPWFTCSFGVSALVAGALFSAVWAMVFRQEPASLVVGTLVIMIFLQALNTQGNRFGRSGEGASEMLPLAQILWEKHPDVIPYDITDGRKRIPPDLAIYMNRPIRQVTRFEQIPTEDRTQLYIALQRRSAPEPVPEPGWKLLAKVPRDKDWWVAFVHQSPSPGTPGEGRGGG